MKLYFHKRETYKLIPKIVLNMNDFGWRCLAITFIFITAQVRWKK